MDDAILAAELAIRVIPRIAPPGRPRVRLGEGSPLWESCRDDYPKGGGVGILVDQQLPGARHRARAMDPAPTATTGLDLTGRAMRRYGAALVPLSIVANVFCFVLAVWLLENLRPAHIAHLDAWRIVTVLVLVCVQAMWLVWLYRQRVGTYVASLLLWALTIVTMGFEAVAVQPGVTVAVFALAAGTTRWLRGLLVAGGTALVAGVVAASHVFYASSGAVPHPAAPMVVAALLAGLATVALPAFAGAWYGQLRDRAERIATLARRATTGETARTAAAIGAERRALAAEIHDTSSAHLTAILALTTAARALTPGSDGEVSELLGQIHDDGRSLFQGYERMLESLQQEDRTITGTFQPGYRPGQHATSELPALVADFRRTTDAAIDFAFDPALERIDQSLGPMRSHIAFRVVQEALNNVRKHAPHASVSISLEDDGDSLLIRVENGPPPEVPTGIGQRRPSLHLGIAGIRDRLIAAGGSLRTGPRQSGGWVVQALLPHMASGRGPSPSRAVPPATEQDPTP